MLYREWVKPTAVGVGLAVITVATYWTVLYCDFVSYDDPYYVSENQRTLAGLSWAGWAYAWTSFDCANWHPLTWLSLQLDATLWGRNPFGYHLTNLVLHAANVVLLFAVLKQLTGSTGRSACVAGFFGLHPLHVESVAWISERKDVLCTLFLLLTTAAYVRYAALPSFRRYWPVAIVFALGLLAKPMLVTLPVLFLLLDAWPLNRIEWEKSSPLAVRFPSRSPAFLVLEKVPLLALAFADGRITVAAQRVDIMVLSDLPIGLRIANAIHSCFCYLQKTFWPVNLSVFYPHPENNLSTVSCLFAICVLAAISVCVAWQGRSKPFRSVGWLWFLISLLPVLGLLQVGGQAYADRYVYIPHIGLFIMIVWECHERLWATKVGRIVGLVGAAAILICCGVLTHAQISHWKNTETLWTHALEVDPENGLAHFHLASYRFTGGDYEDAKLHMIAGRRTKRVAKDVNALWLLGMCHIKLGHPEEAEPILRQAILLDPTHVQVVEMLSTLLSNQGRPAEAGQVLAKLGLAMAKRGNFELAIKYFANATRLAPTADTFNNLGRAQDALRRNEEAKESYRRALELNPNLAAAHFNLALRLEAEKSFTSAKMHFAEVLRVEPNDAEARLHLANLTSKSP